MVPPYSDRISRVPPYSRIKFNLTHTGLSPAEVSLSRLFCSIKNDHWPVPLSLAATNRISFDVFSSGYLDVSVPRVCFFNLCIQLKIPNTNLDIRPSEEDKISGSVKVGFPIRKSLDQSLFAAPQRLSQRITSFIASVCQGIH